MEKEKPFDDSRFTFSLLISPRITPVAPVVSNVGAAIMAITTQLVRVAVQFAPVSPDLAAICS